MTKLGRSQAPLESLITNSLELLSNPVSTKCGHNFCSFCISTFLNTKRTVPCPLCKTSVTKRSLQSRTELNLIIQGVKRLIAAFEEDTGEICTPSKEADTFLPPATPETSSIPVAGNSSQKKKTKSSGSKNKPRVVSARKDREENSEPSTSSYTSQDCDSIFSTRPESRTPGEGTKATRDSNDTDSVEVRKAKQINLLTNKSNSTDDVTAPSKPSDDNRSSDSKSDSSNPKVNSRRALLKYLEEGSISHPDSTVPVSSCTDVGKPETPDTDHSHKRECRRRSREKNIQNKIEQNADKVEIEENVCEGISKMKAGNEKEESSFETPQSADCKAHSRSRLASACKKNDEENDIVNNWQDDLEICPQQQKVSSRNRNSNVEAKKSYLAGSLIPRDQEAKISAALGDEKKKPSLLSESFTCPRENESVDSSPERRRTRSSSNSRRGRKNLCENKNKVDFKLGIFEKMSTELSSPISICSVSSTQQLQKPIQPVSRTYSKKMKNAFRNDGEVSSWSKSLMGVDNGNSDQRSILEPKDGPSSSTVTNLDKINTVDQSMTCCLADVIDLEDEERKKITEGSNVGDKLPCMPNTRRKTIFKSKNGIASSLVERVDHQSNASDPYDFKGGGTPPAEVKPHASKRERSRRQTTENKARNKIVLNISSLTHPRSVATPSNCDSRKGDTKQNQIEDTKQNQIEDTKKNKKEDRKKNKNTKKVCFVETDNSLVTNQSVEMRSAAMKDNLLSNVRVGDSSVHVVDEYQTPSVVDEQEACNYPPKTNMDESEPNVCSHVKEDKRTQKVVSENENQSYQNVVHDGTKPVESNVSGMQAAIEIVGRRRGRVRRKGRKMEGEKTREEEIEKMRSKIKNAEDYELLFSTQEARQQIGNVRGQRCKDIETAFGFEEFDNKEVDENCDVMKDDIVNDNKNDDEELLLPVDENVENMKKVAVVDDGEAVMVIDVDEKEVKDNVDLTKNIDNETMTHGNSKEGRREKSVGNYSNRTDDHTTIQTKNVEEKSKVLLDSTSHTVSSLCKDVLSAKKTSSAFVRNTARSFARPNVNVMKLFEPEPQQSPNVVFQSGPQQSPNIVFQSVPQQSPNVVFQSGPQQSPNVVFQSGPQQSPNVVFQSGPQQSPNVVFQSGPQQSPNVVFQSGPQQSPNVVFQSGPQQSPKAVFETPLSLSESGPCPNSDKDGNRNKENNDLEEEPCSNENDLFEKDEEKNRKLPEMENEEFDTNLSKQSKSLEIRRNEFMARESLSDTGINPDNVLMKENLVPASHVYDSLPDKNLWHGQCHDEMETLGTDPLPNSADKDMLVVDPEILRVKKDSSDLSNTKLIGCSANVDCDERDCSSRSSVDSFDDTTNPSVVLAEDTCIERVDMADRMSMAVSCSHPHTIPDTELTDMAPGTGDCDKEFDIIDRKTSDSTATQSPVLYTGDRKKQTNDVSDIRTTVGDATITHEDFQNPKITVSCLDNKESDHCSANVFLCKHSHDKISVKDGNGKAVKQKLDTEDEDREELYTVQETASSAVVVIPSQDSSCSPSGNSLSVLTHSQESCVTPKATKKLCLKEAEHSKDLPNTNNRPDDERNNSPKTGGVCPKPEKAFKKTLSPSMQSKLSSSNQNPPLKGNESRKRRSSSSLKKSSTNSGPAHLPKIPGSAPGRFNFSDSDDEKDNVLIVRRSKRKCLSLDSEPLKPIVFGGVGREKDCSAEAVRRQANEGNNDDEHLAACDNECNDKSVLFDGKDNVSVIDESDTNRDVESNTPPSDKTTKVEVTPLGKFKYLDGNGGIVIDTNMNPQGEENLVTLSRHEHLDTLQDAQDSCVGDGTPTETENEIGVKSNQNVEKQEIVIDKNKTNVERQIDENKTGSSDKTNVERQIDELTEVEHAMVEKDNLSSVIQTNVEEVKKTSCVDIVTDQNQEKVEGHLDSQATTQCSSSVSSGGNQKKKTRRGFARKGNAIHEKLLFTKPKEVLSPKAKAAIYKEFSHNKSNVKDTKENNEKALNEKNEEENPLENKDVDCIETVNDSDDMQTNHDDEVDLGVNSKPRNESDDVSYNRNNKIDKNLGNDEDVHVDSPSPELTTSAGHDSWQDEDKKKIGKELFGNEVVNTDSESELEDIHFDIEISPENTSARTKDVGGYKALSAVNDSSKNEKNMNGDESVTVGKNKDSQYNKLSTRTSPRVSGTLKREANKERDVVCGSSPSKPTDSRRRSKRKNSGMTKDVVVVDESDLDNSLDCQPLSSSILDNADLSPPSSQQQQDDLEQSPIPVDDVDSSQNRDDGDDSNDDSDEDEPVNDNDFIVPSKRRKRQQITSESDGDTEIEHYHGNHSENNHTCSSAVSSQSEILSTEQRDALEKDVADLKEQIATVEAALHGNEGSSSTPQNRKHDVVTVEDSPLYDDERDDDDDNDNNNKMDEGVDSDEDLFILPPSPSPPEKPPHKPPVVSTRPVLSEPGMDVKTHEMVKQFTSHRGGSLHKRRPLLEFSNTAGTVSQSEKTLSEWSVKVDSEDEARMEDSRLVDNVQINIELDGSNSPVIHSQGSRSRVDSSQKTLDKSLVSSVTTSAHIVASGLNRQEMQLVQKACSTLSHVSYNARFGPGVTHVIMKTVPGEDRMCDRTLKYFQGLAHGVWIVSLQWLVHSLQAGELLSEKEFEILGDTSAGDRTTGPRKARLNKDTLFKDYSFACVGNSQELSRECMEELLKSCGGCVLADVIALPLSKRDKKIIIRCTEEDMGDLERMMLNGVFESAGVVSVKRDWILDCISSYQILPLDIYLLTGSC